MLNFKYKSQHVRIPINRTDSICIIEFDDEVTRAFAKVIPNKGAAQLFQ
ncbi:hypothetical protein H312_02092 [Anncaliia algerae PRA339]|uniref:Uncharacterized protein n=1 Tax=Anncaliia algerae PRA339 TaxID=1288291 RepID=A0A059F0I2_9MICR|nr:hypothetical protein H312_02092 [Anncaliia algerae PRA339]